MRFACGCGIGPAKSWDNVEIFRKVREDGILPLELVGIDMLEDVLLVAV